MRSPTPSSALLERHLRLLLSTFAICRSFPPTRSRPSFTAAFLNLGSPTSYLTLPPYPESRSELEQDPPRPLEQMGGSFFDGPVYNDPRSSSMLAALEGVPLDERLRTIVPVS